MITYEFGDILLLRAFPFASLDDTKKRPALVLAETNDQDLVLARITSGQSRNEYDFLLDRWNDFGLLLSSTVRLSKIATLDKRLIIKKLGRIGSPERRAVRTILKKLFS